MIEIRKPVTEDEITITTPVATSRNVEVEVSTFVCLAHFLVQWNPDFAIVTCDGLSRFMLQISSGSYASQARDLTMCFPTYIFQFFFSIFFRQALKNSLQLRLQAKQKSKKTLNSCHGNFLSLLVYRYL